MELNTDTRLRTAVDSHARRVWLDRGEAYFEVAHDASRPFAVVATFRSFNRVIARYSDKQAAERRARDMNRKREGDDSAFGLRLLGA